MMFKNILQIPERYKIRKELVETFIRALYLVLWDPEQPLNSRIKYYVLHAPGPRHESAWVEFAMGSRCHKEHRVAMFPPFSEGSRYSFITHRHWDQAQSSDVRSEYDGRAGDIKDISERIQSKGKDWDEASKQSSMDVLKGLPGIGWL